MPPHSTTAPVHYGAVGGRISGINGALFYGLLTGIADAVIVRHTAGLPLAPLLFFLPLVWIACCVLVRVPFLLPPLRRWADAAVIVAGPGLLIVSRLGPYLRSGGLAVLASVALCAAIAAALAVAFPRFIPPRATAIGAMLCLVWLAATAPFALRSGDERNAIAANSAAPPGSPNVLLIFLDTVRYDEAQQLPNLAKLASASVVFDHAWAPAPWTLPSHFGVLTGVQPWKVPHDARFVYDGPTLAERFAARGYATAAIFANPSLQSDRVFHRGFQQFAASRRSVPMLAGVTWLLNRTAIEILGWDPTVVLSPDWLKASEVSAKALRYIRQTKEPYFLALNYMDAHAPYYIEPQCRGRMELPTANDWKAWQNTVASRVPIRRDRAARIRGKYRAAMRCMDRSIGTLLDEVLRAQNGRPTVVAVVGDHGEQFGRHNLVEHGQLLFTQVLHVPFIFKAPGQPPHRVAEEVTTLDLYRQLLRYLPASQLAAAPSQPVIAAYALRDPWQDRKKESAVCIVRGGYHLIESNDGSALLYDVRFDSDEMRPLPIRPGDPQLAALEDELRQQTREVNAHAVALRSLRYLQ